MVEQSIFIILGMSADEPHEHRALVEKNHRKETVIVAPDVENVAVVADIIHRIETQFHLGKVRSISLFDGGVPFVECSPCIGMGFPKLVQLGLADDDH